MGIQIYGLPIILHGYPWIIHGWSRDRDGKRKRKKEETQQAIVLTFVESILWKVCWILGSKAPGNSPVSFLSNKILVILCEGPKPNISMISGFLTPGGPLSMDSNIPTYVQKYAKIWKRVRTYYFCKSGNLECWKCWKVRVPNFVDFRNLIFEILKIKRMIWEFGNFKFGNLKIRKIEQWN